MNDTIPVAARIGTGEVAAMLGCSRQYVARQCMAGTWPHTRAAGRYRFTLDDLAVILRMTRREPRPAPTPAPVTFAELPVNASLITPTRRRPALDVHRYARIEVGR